MLHCRSTRPLSSQRMDNVKSVYAMPIACRTPSSGVACRHTPLYCRPALARFRSLIIAVTDACLTASMLYLCCRRPGAAAAEPQLQPQAQAEARAALPFAERELAFPSFDLASQVSSKHR